MLSRCLSADNKGRQYPTEYIKTRMQLGSSTSPSALRLVIQAVRSHGIRVLYTGAGAFCLSNASKSGVRFLTFDMMRGALPRDAATNKPTSMSTMISGVTAGVVESLTVVTPGENIKTRAVESRTAGKSSSAWSVMREIAGTKGISGFYRGLLPVTLKQASNALVRFTSYHAIHSHIQRPLGEVSLTGLATPIAGASAGVITVYATMPFDVIKTKMQSTSRGRGDRGALSFVVQTAKEEGLGGLWKGTTPRLLRLSVSLQAFWKHRTDADSCT